MFHICLLDNSIPDISDKCWIETILYPITDYDQPIGTQQLLAVFKEMKPSKEQLFFCLSHPEYFILNNQCFYLSSYQNEFVFKENFTRISPPEDEIFLALSFENDQLAENAYPIQNIPELRQLIDSHLLIFNNLQDFCTFSDHMSKLCNDVNAKSFIDYIKNKRRENFALLKENKWHKEQAAVLRTSLSLIRTEYQADLKWYKDELEKVITWYRVNHEELPPGFVRLGKGLNAIRKKIRLKRS